MLKLSIFFLMLFLLAGCVEIACPEEYDMGTFELSESSKILFPYGETDFKIVFSDSLGNEVVASASRVSTVGFGTVSSDNVQCLSNPEETIKVRARTENVTEFISIPELSMGFEVGFRASPNLTEYEEGLVQDVGNILSTGPTLSSLSFPIPQIVIVLNQRSDSRELLNPDTAEPTFSIHGKEYQNVYSNKRGTGAIKFYYNHDIGIIGFKQVSTGVLYGFERFE